MKIYDDYCDELEDNDWVLKNSHFTCYYKPGHMLHRVNGPAWEWTYGNKEWWYNGKWIMNTKGDVTPKQLLDFKLRIL